MAAALILIDVQKGLDEPRFGKRNNPRAETNMAKLLQHWRNAKLPVFHVRHFSTEEHSPLRPELPGAAIKEFALPEAGEKLFSKNVNSAFIGTELEAELRARGIKQIVLCGLTTDHCVSTSARMGANLGFEVILVSDATATFERTGPDGKHWTADEMHSCELASLHGEFATVLDTAGALAAAQQAREHQRILML
jgi:nicotinamidase-related amidase